MKLALFTGDSIQSYESGLIKEISREAKEKGYQLDIFANCCVPSGDYLHIEGLKKVFYLTNLSNYDGIITADDTLHNYEMNKDLRKYLKKAKCPVVCIRNSVDGCFNIIFDDRHEIYNMTRHIIHDHGCRDIGFVTGTFDLDDTTNRLSGFMDAMLEAGLIINEEEDIFHGNYWSNQGDETAEFFQNRAKGMPEAIICSNDYMAIALIDSLKKKGIKCPEDVIVTGLDNIPESNENIPMLTTIDFDIKEMVSAAIDVIENYNKNPESITTTKKLIPGRCIYRSSCGCMNINDVLVQNYEMMRDIITEEFSNAIQCVNMNMDFGSVLDTEECILRALQLLRNTGRYGHIYAVLKNRLYAEVTYDYNNQKDSQISSSTSYQGKVRLIPDTEEGLDVTKDYPISKSRNDELSGKTNVFYPINCQDELYGYFVIQLKDTDNNGKEIERYFDVVTAQLLIVVGNTLKKLELLSLQGELEDIKKLYQQDPLTGLYNRRGFENSLRHLYQSEEGDVNLADEYRVIISSIDVDGLKYINDNFGHYEGDRAIKAVAECLQEVLKENEFAARIGGDEFSATILLSHGEKKNTFRDKLYAAVKQKASRFTKYTFGVSVGLAEVKSYRMILEGMKEADEDMYKQKRLHHEQNPNF